MARRKIAPLACPKCGEERLWRTDTDPNTPLKKGAAILTGAGAMSIGMSAERGLRKEGVGRGTGSLLGGMVALFFGSLVTSGIKATMVYKCGKCGFTGKYRED